MYIWLITCVDVRFRDAYLQQYKEAMSLVKPMLDNIFSEQELIWPWANHVKLLNLLLKIIRKDS